MIFAVIFSAGMYANRTITTTLNQNKRQDSKNVLPDIQMEDGFKASDQRSDDVD